MSFHNVLPFDLLTGQGEPFRGFGMPKEYSLERELVFLSAAEQARKRVGEGFGCQFQDFDSIPLELDRIVKEMWSQGWNPNTANINLFTTDFGLLLGKALLDSRRGDLIFRSEDSLDHFSIWWPDRKVEAFPFHKAYKCLYHQKGDSFCSFTKGVLKNLNDAVLRKNSSRGGTGDEGAVE